ncbi:MAG: hypothetical protein ACRCWS_03075, partial [Propionibacteriaceae bacterium]
CLTGCTTTTTTPTIPPQATPTHTTQVISLEQAQENFLTYEAEVDRLMLVGGTSEATDLMRQYAMGDLLAEDTAALQQQLKDGWVVEDKPKIGSFRQLKTAEGADISVATCSDSRFTFVHRKDGTREAGRIVQKVTDFRLVNGKLMLIAARDEVGGTCDAS